jgi:hypothetical protein
VPFFTVTDESPSRRSFLNRTSMTTGAGEVQIGRVNVEEIVAVGFELLQLVAAALRENDVALVAIIGGDGLCSVVGLVVSVMAAETAG